MWPRTCEGPVVISAQAQDAQYTARQHDQHQAAQRIVCPMHGNGKQERGSGGDRQPQAQGRVGCGVVQHHSGDLKCAAGRGPGHSRARVKHAHKLYACNHEGERTCKSR